MAHGRIIPPPGPAYLSAAARAIIEQPIERTPVHPPDDPGPAAPEPGLDPVPKPSAELYRRGG